MRHSGVMSSSPKFLRSPVTLGLLGGLAALVIGAIVLNPPDRPVPRITPGSSPGPAFAVQIIRPRMGLPLGGIAPPGWFGLDEELGFASGDPGARVGRVEPGRLELAAEGWELVLVLDGEGRVTPATHVEFGMVFEDEPRRVRCFPGEVVVGHSSRTVLDSGEWSGAFDVELARCEDAATGEALGWPPDPLRLRGSFDRLVPSVADGRH